MNSMKKTLLWMSMAFAATAYAASPASSPEVTAGADLKPLQQQAQAAAMTAQFLTRFHYKTMPLDDAMSEKIFDRYLKALDPEKLFFVQADVDKFAFARTKMDDAINTQDLSTPFAMFNLYEQRMKERMIYARGLLKQDFNFDKNENYFYARDKAAWPQTEAAMQDLWLQRVKNDWLRLKLAGKEEKAIRATLEKRYDYTLTRMQKLKSEDVFQLFMNAYATAIEPHTNYLGPKASEDFEISMKLSLVGIGAVLQERDEMTTIRELSPGGPAALSGKLQPGDRIVGVGQGLKSTPVDVMGWRLDDVVALIRGAKDTVVLLDILPADAGPDGKHKLVSLVRNKITLEQQSAKKSIIEVKSANASDAGNAGTPGMRRIGVIALPTFYQDFDARRKGDKEFKSATRDVARLLAELKTEKVDSVLIDLRNNGGGSLSEAVELTSLFIGKGPVVQQRNSQGNIQIESEKSAKVVWDGPMGVMINRGSASASEIFAAAIQDYGRGLVIGESSFGKGTVQTMVNLDQVAHSDKPKFGELKMTIAQFFRINGGTTQLRGVTPDISFPSFSDPESFGESSYDNALPWVQIKPAEYQTVGDLKDLLPLLQVRHEMRVANDKEFQFIVEDVNEYKLLRDKKTISLNEVERRKERDTQEQKVKEREKMRLKDKLANGKNGDQKDDKADAKVADKAATQDDGLQANERSLASELAAEKARKDAKDVLLEEAAHILGDEVNLLKSHHKLAEGVINDAMRKAQPSSR
jgi:carboxyl-terminal processing protease